MNPNQILATHKKINQHNIQVADKLYVLVNTLQFMLEAVMTHLKHIFMKLLPIWLEKLIKNFQIFHHT